MILTQVLQPSCIKVPLKGKDKPSVIKEIVDVLDSNKLLLDKKQALSAILAREGIRSTGIGSGVAIPHGKCNAVKELVIAVGISKEPVDFESIDGKGVDIVIMLVSPIDQTGPHIQALAKISRLMLDSSFRAKLAAADSPQQAYELLCSKEKD